MAERGQLAALLLKEPPNGDQADDFDLAADEYFEALESGDRAAKKAALRSLLDLHRAGGGD